MEAHRKIVIPTFGEESVFFPAVVFLVGIAVVRRSKSCLKIFCERALFHKSELEFAIL